MKGLRERTVNRESTASPSSLGRGILRDVLGRRRSTPAPGLLPGHIRGAAFVAGQVTLAARAYSRTLALAGNEESSLVSVSAFLEFTDTDLWRQGSLD